MITTNYEKIQKLSLDEMVEFLNEINQTQCENCTTFDFSECKNCFGDQCGLLATAEKTKEWLESAVVL